MAFFTCHLSDPCRDISVWGSKRACQPWCKPRRLFKIRYFGEFVSNQRGLEKACTFTPGKANVLYPWIHGCKPRQPWMTFILTSVLNSIPTWILTSMLPSTLSAAVQLGRNAMSISRSVLLNTTAADVVVQDPTYRTTIPEAVDYDVQWSGAKRLGHAVNLHA